MTPKMSTFNHSDSIWTWKTAKGRKKATLWLPYFQGVERSTPRSKVLYRFDYNGGSFEADLREIDCIMIYGATGHLPVSFLDSLGVQGIHLLIHRRGMTRPYVFTPSQGAPTIDRITTQIAARENAIRRTYVARSLIKERISSMNCLIQIPDSVYRRLNQSRSIQSIRNIEAQVTKRYWAKFYDELSIENGVRRNKELAINTALDACSFFLFGIILRWTSLHRLSPWHGFLHEPTTYASLCYDLMEPYRVWFERSVFESYKKVGHDKEKLTATSISEFKKHLEQDVQVPKTRQVIARKNLLHGVTLALVSYLEKEQSRFLIPVEGIKKAGRPMKSGYRIPGEKLRSGW